jgi:hypothetical protein
MKLNIALDFQDDDYTIKEFRGIAKNEYNLQSRVLYKEDPTIAFYGEEKDLIKFMVDFYGVDKNEAKYKLNKSGNNCSLNKFVKDSLKTCEDYWPSSYSS